MRAKITRAEVEDAIKNHGERAEVVAYARDVLALFTERDDAQARVRELEATTTAATIRDVHKALGAAPGQSVVARAVDVMASAAHEASERIRMQVDLDAAHTRIGQMQVEHARVERRWLANPTQQAVLDILGIAAGDRTDPIGRIKALVGAERERDRLLRSEADVCAILGAAPDELLSDAAARVMVDLGDMTLAEAEPPQVFRPPISVTVHHVTGHAFAEVEVGDVTDPAFLALPMGVRLGLVVLRA